MPVSAVANAASQASADRTRLSDNYDTFLVLLTSQLQNQDPLSPMDSAQFTQQLVQFSQVEQQIRTNEQLESLLSSYNAAAAGTALSYLGRSAVIASDTTNLVGGQAQWNYSLAADANDVAITVKDARGRIVRQAEGERAQGAHSFSWDGRDFYGNTLPDGVYSLSVTARDEAGESIDASIEVRETIRGVDFTGSSPLVVTDSGSRSLSAIRAVLDGG